MNDKSKSNNGINTDKMWQGGPYVLIVLAVIVLLLMFVAWAMPPSTPRPPSTPLPGTQILPTQPPVTQPGQSTPVFEPTAENVGYANGIIIFSAILSLVLLIATLREILFYRKKDKSQTPSQSE